MSGFNPKIYGAPVSISKMARQGSSSGKSYTPLVGLVERTTEKAILFKSDELLSRNLKSPMWIPRKAVDQGDAIQQGDEELHVADWFLDKQETVA